ncbi:MAG: N-formylglutamate amidohydrolase [Acetobacteraceae bacterium]|nr:N-formylglutamate amidohydrolase [Acetobacteraceae bacterium]MSP29373.1 N-formylglutamate amidohydrolase [Acetobacteraceae bacterium]
MDLPVVPLTPAAPTTAAPFVLRAPSRQSVPLVFVSPHSGRDYPADLLAATRLDRLGLRRSEDSFVDNLFAAAPAHGAPLLAALFPRVYCDANREAWELDQAMFADKLPDWVNTTSPRVGAGLGTIARVVATGEAIYQAKLHFAEAQRRVHVYWQPFHDALSTVIAETIAAFDTCLLIDCHSMPAHGGASRHGAGPADIVLGDAFGTACAPAITSLVERQLRSLGYAVRRNDPYAGGYITRHYGRPREGVHVLQLELARGLYMDEATIEPSPRFPIMRRHLEEFISTLAHAAPSLLAG